LKETDLGFLHNREIFLSTELKAKAENIYARVIALPHFGHFISKQGVPCRCAAFSPQFGHTQVPPGPAP
jgi:hypothetical protein